MKVNRLANIVISVAPLLLATSAYGAGSAVMAVPTQQGMPADGHAGHEEPAVDGSAVEKGSAGRSAAWTAFPILKIKAGGEGRERRVVMVIPQGIVANSINAYSNDIQDAKGSRQLPLDMAGAKLDKPDAGGYHWLAAREEQDGKVRVASTVHYFSELGAQNPTAMFMQQKHELEIIPQPYAREHSRYRANEDWKFLVRFNGKPLAGQTVLMETANGTRTELVSDAQGVIKVRIPDDFKTEVRQQAAANHDHRRRSADLVLATEHAEGGKNYLTAFNAGYGTDAFYQRSLAMGLGFTFLGMAGAIPLLRQRKDKNRTANAGQETNAPAAVETNKNEDA